MNKLLLTHLGNYLENRPSTKEIVEIISKEELSRYLKLLFATQHTLNNELCGVGYERSLYTDKGKAIRFGNALLSEANELLDSTPWKHWKDVADEIDEENIKTELIDNLHFLPSVIFVGVARDCEDEGYNDTIIDNYISELDVSYDAPSQSFVDIVYDFIHTTNSDRYENKLEVESMELSSFVGMLSGTINLHPFFNPTLKEESSLIPGVKNSYIQDNIIKEKIMRSTTAALGLTIKMYLTNFDGGIEDIWNKYIVKNTLNSFRANNGYKDGTYVKMWNGDEDNVVAQRIAENNPGVTRDELYEMLTVKYDELTEAGTL